MKPDELRFPWPPGFRSGAALTFDLDAESAVLATHPEFARRMSTMSHQSYGPLTGVPRLLRLLDKHDLRATFFVPGYTAHRYPDVVRSIASAGHEIGAHGYLHESPATLDVEGERQALQRGLDALEEVTGTRPVGYRAPMWELTFDSPAVMAASGVEYDSSLMDMDVPYLFAAKPDDLSGAALVEVPVQWALDDWEQYAFIPDVTGSGVISSPSRVLEMWTLELEALHSEGGCFVLTNHPFLSGRPSRAAALDQLIERMKSHADMWIATVGEIAAHTRAANLAPRRLAPPELPGSS